MKNNQANPSKIRKSIDDFIADALTPENREKYFANPEKDFTRNRKLSLSDTVFHMMTRSSGPLTHNLQEDFGPGNERPSKSALVQQVAKVKEPFFSDMTKSVTKEFGRTILYKGKYRLLACDGTDLGINDKSEEYRMNTRTGKDLVKRPYYSLHINTLYDLCGEFFDGCIIEGSRDYNERKACWKMMEEVKDKAIVICDRGYESYNLFAHLSKQDQFYVIRVKEPFSRGGVARYWWKLNGGPKGEGEVHVKTKLTRIDLKETRDSGAIHFIPSNIEFDFLPQKSIFRQGHQEINLKDIPENQYCKMEFRLVRFRINDQGKANEFETIATNLPEEEFPAEELKKLYGMRWKEETGFRKLKYDELLLKLHSVKAESVIKEIHIALLMHNITSFLIASAAIRKQAKEGRKRRYCYVISHSDASSAVRLFFRRKGRCGPRELMQELVRNLEPLREDRNFPRHLHPKGFVAFTYRAA